MTTSPSRPFPKTVVLVGLMGSGKSSVGRRLARHLGLPFVDADSEIAEAAGCSIEDIFEVYGEVAFREGERRVISRLLEGEPKVLATGGGSWIDRQTREKVAERAISVWLRAELEILVKRIGRRGGRPLLKDVDPKTKLEQLIEERYPVYARADITVDTGDEPPENTVNQILDALEDVDVAAAQGDEKRS
ncbi:MAG: shikimate kinase [Rhodospirillales bacterium]|nr:shikimate kinase [Rhodospirillales bacterium]MDP6805541.1 shikimate kinase [Rhodospirillales bacterium]